MRDRGLDRGADDDVSGIVFSKSRVPIYILYIHTYTYIHNVRNHCNVQDTLLRRLEKLRRFQVQCVLKAMGFGQTNLIVYSTCSIHWQAYIDALRYGLCCRYTHTCTYMHSMYT